MRCKQCDYPLSALRTRECPECGRPFLPSSYEFVPNSVRFCCPHCEQSYYGTGDRGHLVPPHFDCVSCERHIDMDDMVLFPAHGVKEEQTAIEQMPWLNRRKRGPVRAWFATIGMAMTAPRRLMRLTPVESSIGQAYWFGILCNMIFLILALFPIMFFPLAFVLGGRTGAFMGVGGFLFAVLILGPLLGLLVFALGVHALLCLTGRRSHGFGRTFQAIAYSSGVNAVSAIPCLGIYLSFVTGIWWLIGAILMLVEGQHIRGGRASFCVLTLPVLLLAGVITGGVVVTQRTMATMKSFQTTSIMETQTVLTGLLAYHTRQGRWPQHAVELVTASDLNASNLTGAQTRTTELNVLVGGIHLDQLEGASDAQTKAAIRSAVSKLPGGIVAHRLGDFVFAYHGISGTPPDPQLWLVLYYPDPKVNGPPSPSERLVAGLADGTTQVISVHLLKQALAKQNALRANHGLPPLPDPAKITHANPATANPPTSTQAESAAA